MVQNDAGGYTFQLTPLQKLERFLILGTEGGTFYVKEQPLTLENAANIMQLVSESNETGTSVLKAIYDISTSGRAFRQSPGIFALAIAASHGTLHTKKAAFVLLPHICRTGSTLLEFVSYVDKMRGWGRLLRDSLNWWYLRQDVNRLAYQVVKYRQRHGWTHRDVLRKTHPKVNPDSPINTLFAWLTKKEKPDISDPQLKNLQDFVALQDPNTSMKTALNILENGDATWEFLPTETLKQPEIWRTLLNTMPMQAMVTNLSRMSRLGVLEPLTLSEKLVCQKLKKVENLRNARLHPFSLLYAWYAYKRGRAIKGNTTWTPNTNVERALANAYSLAFKNVEPTEHNYYIGLDISGSMQAYNLFGSALTCHQGAAALAYQIAKTEPWTYIRPFTHTTVDVPIMTDSLESVIEQTRYLPMGATDCAQPMIDAMAKKLDVDVFVVITDNETWVSNIHPAQALRLYRKKMNKPNAKLIVIGMVATDFSIADPLDPNMLDIVGFDANTPELIAKFANEYN